MKFTKWAQKAVGYLEDYFSLANKIPMWSRHLKKVINVIQLLLAIK